MVVDVEIVGIITSNELSRVCVCVCVWIGYVDGHVISRIDLV